MYPLLRPLLFQLDPERAHALTLAALRLRGALPAATRPVANEALSMRIAGLMFPNPVGLAAGFDKNAVAVAPLFGLGFGSVEAGTITPEAQEGNPRPRLFRLEEDAAIVNRMGFNNAGGAAAKRTVAQLRRAGPLPGPLGINIGANKDSRDRVDDYRRMAAMMAPLADYLSVNISSPNTPGLRALQEEAALREVVAAVREGAGARPVPIFLKVAPDLSPDSIDAVARVAVEERLDALIVANTTVSRPPLHSRWRDEAGGLSGAPLRTLAVQALRDMRQATGGTIPLVGVGGIATGADAWERIRAGASLVQLYSALVYGGPGLPRRILRDLARLMRRDGFASVAQAVGTQ
ncbi:quinone-dependent dihydroorotate dehydrogenase [Erythrobacteraceae bacterium CFH 75059]|uniref:quinone-dependent dihydroorotate dehydrogenase n=1 Tax=Qipengyuania thermophila TaxID=2509361 RepID=UPI0010202C02|nr:quinone-dependent dihydroorotate dehydrogenase [Qipengyuania thermophila]TCD06621.1 quinone-dependent dihydroorotate dehydrogenase [Erythrobacteraceae bacterium CFH 75059]